LRLLLPAACGESCYKCCAGGQEGAPRGVRLVALCCCDCYTALPMARASTVLSRTKTAMFCACC
jgi:hypothetical protein